MSQYLIPLIVVGLLAGVIGHLMLKGRSPGLVITLIVGLAGAFFGNWILHQINGTFIQVLFAAAGATLLLWLVSLFKK